jgi:hypothetical protein
MVKVREILLIIALALLIIWLVIHMTVSISIT